MKRIAGRLCISVLALGVVVELTAFENLIGEVVENRTFETSALDELELELAPADILIFDFDDYRFVDAVEVHAELPPQLANREDITIAALVYGELADPPPGTGELTTRARRLHFDPMVERHLSSFSVPVRKDAPDAVISSRQIDIRPEEEAFPLAVTFLPIGKWLPDDFPEARILLRARPVSRGVGKLVLDISAPDDDVAALDDLGDYELIVAGAARESDSFFLAPGFHDVVLEAPGYKKFAATAPVEEGQASELSVNLEPEPATLFLDAPRGTQVFINDSIVGGRLGTRIALEPGEHEITIRIGERSVTQVMRLQAGGSYEARVNIGLEVREEASEQDENERQDDESTATDGHFDED